MLPQSPLAGAFALSGRTPGIGNRDPLAVLLQLAGCCLGAVCTICPTGASGPSGDRGATGAGTLPLYNDSLVDPSLAGGGLISYQTAVDSLKIVRRITVPNIAALAAVPAEDIPDGGMVAYVVSLNADFWLQNPTDPVPGDLISDNITVVDALNTADGVWIRRIAPVLGWVRQPDWYIDQATGNDENSGILPGSPLATLDEWFRRTGGLFSGVMGARLHLAAGGTWNWTYGEPFPYDAGGNPFVILGTPTVVASDTVQAVTPPAPGSFGTLTSTGLSFAGRGGYIVQTANGAFAALVAGQGGNTVTHEGFVNALVNPGDAFSIVDFDVMTFTRPLMGPIVVQNLRLRNAQSDISADPQVLLQSCYVQDQLQSASFLACTNGPFTENRITRVQNGSVRSASNCAFSLLFITDNAEMNANTTAIGSVSIRNQSFLVALDLGSFAFGSYIVEDSAMEVASSWFGTLSNPGIVVRFQSTLYLNMAGGAAPIATSGGGQDFLIASQANQMPPIAASAGGPLPALAPCTTWPQLFGAPFNGGVQASYKDQSVIGSL